ncbi:hypothetical protein AYJ57_23655 (plasmid) [Salipiger sp. CCB-MM3]|uniref:plasmid replication protein RepC n=1 Tax=Salipiger sp. CCB-MM3 TaxID=1792508 RepID=UPI00080AA280|nr:plasmid replication protein RepC [Salipiger sp. CCB-MM3]ANT63475.1 hypothetical protein AYJ57_23655 [Salipiger sp. CCB-MM3]
MLETSRQPVGRPISACLTAQVGTHDKWALLRDLTTVSEDFGLGHRTLSVLKALLTFWPERELPCDGAIVFPSNRVLCERLSGMPESTLRRHLSKLVESGIVSRHDSPNGKRYARRCGAEIGIAFGFDLSPLARHEAALARAVAENALRRERLAVLRARLGMLRQRLCESAAPCPVLLEEARLLLRRKCSEAVLNEMIERLDAALPVMPKVDVLPEVEINTAPAAAQMSASNSQNERHIQESDRSFSDSDSAQPTNDTPAESLDAAEKDRLTLPQITDTCREYQAFFPEKPRNWHELISMAQRLAPMMGIEAPVLHDAQRTMGPERAAAVLLCLLDRHSEIRKPGAYLRRLTQIARNGGFSVSSMLGALSRRASSGNCQLTI